MIKNRKLGRRSNHRDALAKNLCASLIQRGSIQTTLDKAKAIRPMVEKIITRAIQALNGDLHSLRRALQQLPQIKDMPKLLKHVATLTQERKGGYTSIQRIGHRQDNGIIANIRIVDWSKASSNESTSEQGHQ